MTSFVYQFSIMSPVLITFVVRNSFFRQDTMQYVMQYADVGDFT